MFTVHDSPQVQIAHKNIKIGHTLFTQGTWKIPLLNNYNTGPDFIIQPKLKAFVTIIHNTLNSGYSCRMSFESIIFESAIVVEQSSQIDISVSPKIDANTSLVTMVCFLHHHTACVFLRPSLVTHNKWVCQERLLRTKRGRNKRIGGRVECGHSCAADTHIHTHMQNEGEERLK